MALFSKLPRGIPYIVGNEAAERFSYYGMKTILVVFMTHFLMDRNGVLQPMSEGEAKEWYHLFSMANYFFPILGALVADIFWGKYKTIIRLSLIYCAGHGVLAFFDSRIGLASGLMLIAIGSGGIKPCVSAHVGDQFRAENKDLIPDVFSAFYFAINLGAFFSTLLTPYLLEHYGAHIAFGTPGLFMLLATIVFYLGRKKFIAIPPVGWNAYKREVLSREGVRAIGSLSIVYLFISIFWSLFDQTGSSWVLQAEKMDRFVDLNIAGLNIDWLRFELLASQIQALNPVLIMILVPIFSCYIYPTMNRVIQLTPLRKMVLGMVIAASSFLLTGWIEAKLQSGTSVSIGWQFFAYIILTISEVMVSITSLEFSYTQAPNSLKSLIMGLYFLSVSLGNGITALINYLILRSDGTSALEGAAYFYFFAGLMLLTALLFWLYSKSYQEKIYIQNAPATL